MRLPSRTYYQHHENPAAPGLVRIYCCPCCDYPTTGEPPSHGICPICGWQDDDCDWGANGDYSLEEARQNFRKYLTMYRSTEECDARLQQHGYKFVHDFWLTPDRLESKKRLMAQLDQYMAEPDTYRRGELWGKFQRLLV